MKEKQKEPAALAHRREEAQKLMRDIYGHKLTPRERVVLEHCYETSVDRGGDDGEVVTEGKEAWIGYERTSPAVVLRLLQLMALEPINPDTHDGRNSDYRVFVITKVGIDLLLGNPPQPEEWC